MSKGGRAGPGRRFPRRQAGIAAKSVHAGTQQRRAPESLTELPFRCLEDAPEVERRLHEEIDRVVNDKPEGLSPQEIREDDKPEGLSLQELRAEDVPRLEYTRAVVAESMRLFPPAWTMGRRVVQAHAVGGYELPVDSLVLLSQWVVHRDPRWWSDPEVFRPERWLEGGSRPGGASQSRPKFSYFPFGGGARRCIGESFAWMELVLVLSTIVQRWTLRLVPGHPVVPQPVITLRLKHGLRMTTHRRA